MSVILDNTVETIDAAIDTIHDEIAKLTNARSALLGNGSMPDTSAEEQDDGADTTENPARERPSAPRAGKKRSREGNPTSKRVRVRREAENRPASRVKRPRSNRASEAASRVTGRRRKRGADHVTDSDMTKREMILTLHEQGLTPKEIHEEVGGHINYTYLVLREAR
jgi:hypothetical protein